MAKVEIAGDNDKHLELTQGINPGKKKALEAATAVNGFVILPTFAPQEQAVNPKKFSDFNDLAKNSVLGMEGVKRQVKSMVDKISRKSHKVCLMRDSNILLIA